MSFFTFYIVCVIFNFICTYIYIKERIKQEKILIVKGYHVTNSISYAGVVVRVIGSMIPLISIFVAFFYVLYIIEFLDKKKIVEE